MPAPKTLWASDLTFVATWQGFVDVAFVIDAYAPRIFGMRVNRITHAGFVLDALLRPFTGVGPEGWQALFIIPTERLL